MLNGIPFFGQVNHGLFNYQPKFFTTLIRANGYQPLYIGLSGIFDSGTGIDHFHDVTKAENGPAWEGKHVGCAEMFVVFKKMKNAPFKPPVDAFYIDNRPSGFPSVDEIADEIAARAVTS